jgi:dipeptidyl aminopeptidase/acylaminoacyl peptidase
MYQQKQVLIADGNAANARKLADLPGRLGSLDVSPDGKRLLLVEMSGPIPDWEKGDTFEAETDGSGMHRIRTFSPDECSFRWSWDGKYLLYSARDGKRWDLWALPVHAGPFRSKKPIRLTNGPLSFPQGAIPGRDGKQIFAIGTKQRGEMVRYDMQSHRFVPLLAGISATDATYSRDGNWVAFTTFPDHILWRSRSDGSERMQLTHPPMEAAEPFISPDGTRVAFGTPRDGVFISDMKGGEPQRIGDNLTSPRWSPDGSSIVVNWNGTNGQYGLKVIDLRTGKADDIPGSGDKVGPCWLDQEHLLAGIEGGPNLLIFNLKTRKWTDFFSSDAVNFITSPDGKYVYIASGNPEPGVQRIRVANRHVETIASLRDFPRVINFGWTQLRVAPDGSPTLTRAADGPEVYALNVRWPN